MDILLADSMFSENNEVVIDELLTIFFAGSQTSANVTQNLIMHLCKQPEYKTKIVEEIKLVIGIDVDQDILLKLNVENSQNLSFYSNCFSESMRLQPPVYYSSTVMMNQNVEAAGLKIRKGD